MEFAIGFVLGGVSTGVTVANWSGILEAARAFAAKVQSAAQNTVAARVAALRAKL